MSDPATVSGLLLKHRHALLAYLHAATGDYHAAEDLFQESSLTAVREAAAYTDGSNFAAWVRAIARLKLLEFLRRRRPNLPLNETLLQSLDLEFDALEAAAGPLEDRKDALRHCLQGLSPSARELLNLRYEQGLAAEAIAARTRRSRAAANSLLQRVRETLRDCVERRYRQTLSGGLDTP